MPGYLIAVPGTNTIYALYRMRVWDEDISILWSNIYSYQCRGQKTDPSSQWTWKQGLWPNASRMGLITPDLESFAFSPVNQYNGISGNYEPWQTSVGNATVKVILGRVKDAGGNGISGAIIRCFLTSSNVFVSETVADSNGYFEVSTPYSGQNHYLVAYRSGSPDIGGTTVNNLQPTNRDGS